MQKRVLFVFGTRPETIKLAPVVRELRTSESFEPLVCLTGQHVDLVSPLVEFFELRIDFNLNVMRHDQSPTDVSVAILTCLPSILRKAQPHYVIVQGDTTSAVAASLCAFYSGVKVIHIEAGLRTNNKFSPYPEEINRRLIGQLADIHFAPTPTARRNLLREGIPSDRIYVVGNTVVDALLWGVERLKNSWFRTHPLKLPKMSTGKKIVLSTIHRRESFGAPLKEICLALKYIAEIPNIFIIFPMHPNPNVRRVVSSLLGDVDNILLTDPLSYPEFLYVLDESYLVITDSGGIQEECPTLGKPVLVVRDETERMEGIEAGVAILVGRKAPKIVSTARKLITDAREYDRVRRRVNPYGDGKSSFRIRQVLEGINL